ILVEPHNTSRQCLCCGYTDKDNRPSQAVFRCLECGFEENADVVGAVNILRRGLPHMPRTIIAKLLAPAETQREGHSQLLVTAAKPEQEPSEGSCSKKPVGIPVV
ncbi:MAG: transposase, partial [Actinomycetaceae bacterium]|nr:transposase [Actinomycetaceae bacterium]